MPGGSCKECEEAARGLYCATGCSTQGRLGTQGRGNGCRIAWLRRGIIHRLGVTRLFKE